VIAAHRPLGASGIDIAPIALGCMNLGGPTPDDEGFEILDAALEAGVTFFDTADVYTQGASEEVLGRWLADRGCRDRVVVATKVGMPMGDGPLSRWFEPEHIAAGCDDSLRRLGVDVIDLYQLHRPPVVPGADHEAVLGALDQLVRAGKVRAIGCSTHPSWMVAEARFLAERHGWAPYVSEQPPYNLLDRRIERELVPAARRYGLGVLPWSPLGAGILAGRYAAGIVDGSRASRKAMVADRVTPEALDVAAVVAEVAGDLGCSPAQLALRWCRDQPGITAPIIGPRTAEQAREQVAVLEHPPLDPEVLARFDELVPPGTAVSDFHNNAYW
jgi:1-deoxyxylulose-5-phosphate synthase